MRQGLVGIALINELIDAGQIAREVDPADCRAFALQITTAVRATLLELLRRTKPLRPTTD